MLESDCETNEVTRLFADLDKPSLHGLSYVLRHPETWPRGFKWDYQFCDTCAMGLAHHLWSDFVDEANVSEMARAFALPYSESNNIFQTNDDWAPSRRVGFLWLRKAADWSAITPEMVADEIDRYLARAE
jgi:hypothetical protein